MSVTEQEIRLDFLRFLFGETNGYICIATQSFMGKDFRQEFFGWPHQAEDAIRYIDKSKATKNVWFCVNLLSQQKRTKEYCLPTNLLWADLDTADPEIVKPTPQVLIESSPARYQAIWRLDETIDPYIAEDYSKRIAYQFSENGVDTSGWDLTQLLRVPFTTNFKYTNRPQVKLLSAHEPLFPTEIFDAIEETTPIEQESDEPTPDLLDLDKILYKYASELQKKKFPQLWGYEPTKDDDWSGLLWSLLMKCAEVGMSAEEMFTVAANSTVNKYKRDGRPIKYLWRDVQKAFNQSKSFTTIVLESKPFIMPELIPGQDYGTLSKSWIDEYREWGMEATDATACYHDLSAFMILSSLLSGNLKLETSYGTVKPNLWGMILGETTLDRKSTVMRMATDFLIKTDRDILLASDGSPEGLLGGLQLRSGKTSMFFKDELTGFFSSVAKKDYLAGLPEMLTQLYDVPEFFSRRLRKETISITNVVFIFFGGGITEKMYTLVDESLVHSGFIPRFLVVNGDADLSRFRKTGPPTPAVRDGKEKIQTFLDNLYRSYNRDVQVQFLIGDQKHEAIQPQVIEAVMQQDVWDLYGDIEYRMVEAANQSYYRSLALPTFERMTRSLLKMALLISATRQEPSDGKVEIVTDDVLHAAKYIQEWGHYSIHMLENLGRTAIESVLIKVLENIKENPGINRASIMRRHNLLSKQISEIEKTLEERGQIHISREKGSRYTAI